MSRVRLPNAAVAVAGLLALAHLVPAAALAGQDLPGPVVGVPWLDDNLGTEGLVVVQVGGDREAFAEGHLPGARFLDLGDLAVSRGEYGEPGSVRLDVPADVAPVVSALEDAGISAGSRVVVVAADARRVTSATRTLWTLQYLGMGDRAALLDGGLDGWTAAGRPLETGPGDGPRGSLTVRPDSGVVVTRRWVADHLDAPEVALVDGRRIQAYTGEREEIPGRSGHIPGAGSLPIEELFGEDGRLRPEGELQDLFARAGVAEGDTVVAYCHIGLRASALVLAARVAGFDAVLYDGSMVDWAMDRELPMVAGPDPR